MNREVIENEMTNRFEQRSLHPAMVPMYIAMDGIDRAQQAGAHGLANVTEVWRPAGILVDGELHAHLIGKIGQAVADVEIEHEGLLAEHVFPGS